MNKLPQPPGYEGFTSKQLGNSLSRLNADVLSADRNLIKSVIPQLNIFQWAIQHFIASLANELRQSGITTYTDSSADFVIAAVIRRTNGYTGITEWPRVVEHAEHPVVGDESGTAQSVCERVTTNESIKPGVEANGESRHRRVDRGTGKSAVKKRTKKAA